VVPFVWVAPCRRASSNLSKSLIDSRIGVLHDNTCFQEVTLGVLFSGKELGLNVHSDEQVKSLAIALMQRDCGLGIGS